jgi:creatinine amidohydrolase/Fe(II)-dependent formamide hydrolase-like protein
MVEIWKIANSMAKDIPELKENTFKHAGKIMTSIMLYLHPDMVTMERARFEYVRSSKEHFMAKSTLGPAEFREVEIRLYDRAKHLTESGIMGDPLAATQQKRGSDFSPLENIPYRDDHPFLEAATSPRAFPCTNSFCHSRYLSSHDLP